MKFDYIEKIVDLIKTIEVEEKETMEKVVDMLTTTIIEKHSIYSFGASHAGILSEELFYRAGGLVVMNPIFGREIMLDTSPITLTSKMERCEGYGSILASKVKFKANDVLILHSVSGRNPVTIEMAIEAKKQGVIVIGVTNLAYSKSVTSRHSTNKNLYEFCDIVLDNHGEKGDACVSIPNHEQKVAPTSTVIASIIMNSIIAATAQQLEERGCKALPIFYSANIDGGDALNEEVYQNYKDVIHYQYK